MIDARTSADWGLVNRVVPAADHERETIELAERVARASAYVVALGKRAFYAQDALDEHAAYGVTAPVMSENAQHADAHEGMTAFLEKRDPRWQHR
jgi:enoyl-CoA hydratase/carnithine racemase